MPPGQEYTVKDTQTGKTVTFRWNGAQPPNDRDMAQVFSEARLSPPPATAPKAEPSMLDLGVEAVSRYAKGVVPVDLLKQLYSDVTGEMSAAVASAQSGDVAGAVGHAVTASPIGQGVKLAGQLGQAQLAQFGKAKAAYDRGDYEQASAYTVAGFLPLVGPATTAAGEEVRAGRETGDVKRQVGAVAELGGMLTGPAAVKAVIPKSIRIPGTGKFANPNPAEVAVVEYAARVGIPMEAATATGNPVVRGLQSASDFSLGGALTGARKAAAQTRGLTAEAARLEQAAAPLPVSPESAGAGVRASLEATVKARAAEQNRAYGKFRDIEAAQAEPVQVGTKTITREFDEAPINPHEDLLRAIARNGGLGPDKGMPGEMRTLLESRTQAGGKLGDKSLLGAQRTGSIGGVGRVLRSDGKSLDMMAEALREEGYTAIKGPRELLDAIDDARTEMARPAKAGPKADTFEEPVMETMGLPVDVESAQTMLRPIYDELMREKDITPIMGKEGRALAALDRLMRGPKIAPASVVDGALSKLKAFARHEGMAELRPEGQSIAARAVQVLEARVQEAAARGGPEATAARNAGRLATQQKVAAGTLVKQLKTEPVKAYQQATLPRDTGIDYLRQIQKVAPAEMPKVGRALLTDIFDKARAGGGFKRNDAIWNEWQKVGPETKKALFPDAQHRADLDNFFLLQKQIAANVNPSRSALVGSLILQAGTLLTPYGMKYVLGGAALGKLLHSRAGIKALTEVIRVPTGRSQLAQAAAVSRVGALAGVRPTRVAVPATAEEREAP